MSDKDFKEFIESESIYFKLLYVVGVLLFIFHVNDITADKNDIHYIFPVLSLVVFVIYSIRFIRYHKKNKLS
jgi:hypothetical protein